MILRQRFDSIRASPTTDSCISNYGHMKRRIGSAENFALISTLNWTLPDPMETGYPSNERYLLPSVSDSSPKFRQHSCVSLSTSKVVDRRPEKIARQLLDQSCVKVGLFQETAVSCYHVKIFVVMPTWQRAPCESPFHRRGTNNRGKTRTDTFGRCTKSHTHEFRVNASAVADIFMIGTGAIDHSSGRTGAARPCFSTGTTGRCLR